MCRSLGRDGAGFAPDRTGSPIPLSPDTFKQGVEGRLLDERGMPKFDDLSDRDLDQIRAYVRQQGRLSIPTAKKNSGSRNRYPRGYHRLCHDRRVRS